MSDDILPKLKCVTQGKPWKIKKEKGHDAVMQNHFRK